MSAQEGRGRGPRRRAPGNGRGNGPRKTDAPLETAKIPVGAPAHDLPTPEIPKPGRIRSFLHEYRPSIVTGGASATPLLVIAALNGLDELDRAAFGVLLPEIKDYLGTNLFTITLIASVAIFALILVGLPIGYLADRVNRARLMGTGAVMWGSFSMLTAFAGSVPFMSAARIGSGLGQALAPSYDAYLADAYPPDRRPGVYAFSRLGNQLGKMVAPISAGVLAAWLFWQVPFLVFGLPSIALGFYALFRLREPVRGEQERRVLGASEQIALEAEKPPSWSESWRIAYSVRTLRRIWYSLPFLFGSIAGIISLMSLYYDEEFGLGETARGAIGSIDEVFGIAGLIVGGAYGNRLFANRPRRIVGLMAVVGVVIAGSFVVIAISPWWWLSVVARLPGAFAGAIIGPSLAAMMAAAIPPRARAFAGSLGALWAIPGLLILPTAGALGDAFGIRYGILLLVPVFGVGAAIISSAGLSFDRDIRAAMAAAMAATETRKAKQEGRAKMLVCRDVDVYYGPVQVLFNLDFDVEEGEIVALLGTNGAGKSTLLNAIAGLNAASNGAIFFDGEDVTHLPPSAHVAKGIVTVPGGQGIFPTLSVRDNLRMAAYAYRRDPAYTEEGMARVRELFPILTERAGEPAANLSGGEQQMLTLAQAFLSRPRLLLIDELSLGLAPTVVDQLLRIVRDINASGTTIVLVEQSVNVALTVASRAVFMEKGEVRFVGDPQELLGRADVLRSVFLAGTGVGSAAAAKRRRDKRRHELERPEVLLEVTGVTKSFGGVQAVSDVDLALRSDEILGLIGPNGAGKTTLFDIISGFVEPTGGRVRLLGEDLAGKPPDERATLGLVRSFQDARLFPALTVNENILVALDRHLGNRNPALAAFRVPVVTRAEERLSKRAERLIDILNLGQFRDKFVRELSTGSRRIVDLACVLATDPVVLLLDEPSSGIAQRETEELGPLIQRIKTEADCSILIIEHDMPLISSVSDEIIAMDLGRVVVRGDPDAVLADTRVVSSYLGTSEEAIQRSGRPT